MSDDELIELNKAWGMSICHSYRINSDRVDQKESAAYPAHNSMKVLKAVSRKVTKHSNITFRLTRIFHEMVSDAVGTKVLGKRSEGTLSTVSPIRCVESKAEIPF